MSQSLPSSTVLRGDAPTGKDAVLVAVAFFAALPRLFFAFTDVPEFDGYWHLFIAAQDAWDPFLREYWFNFHPPIFYLVLAAMRRLSASTGWNALVSVVSGVAVVYLIGAILGQLRVRRGVYLFAALFMASSVPMVNLSTEIRGYMLMLALVLLSMSWFVATFDPARPVWAPILFAGFAVAAVLTHYSAAFYVLGSCLAICLRLAEEGRGESSSARLYYSWPLAAFVGLFIYEYIGHAGTHVREGPTRSLLMYYFNPARDASLAAFARERYASLLRDFFPLLMNPEGAWWVVTAVGLMCASVSTLYTTVRMKLPASGRGIVVIAVVTVASLVCASLGGKYPLGGDVRHQLIMLPCLVLIVAIALDLGMAWRRGARWIGIAIPIMLLSSNAVALAHRSSRTEILTANAGDAFHERFWPPDLVFVDRNSLIPFFAVHYDWDWHFVRSMHEATPLDLYRISKDGRSFFVARDLGEWNIPLGGTRLYEMLRALTRPGGFRTVTVFHLTHYENFGREKYTRDPERIVAQLHAHSLCLVSRELEGARADDPGMLQLETNRGPATIFEASACGESPP